MERDIERLVFRVIHNPKINIKIKDILHDIVVLEKFTFPVLFHAKCSLTDIVARSRKLKIVGKCMQIPAIY